MCIYFRKLVIDNQWDSGRYYKPADKCGFIKKKIYVDVIAIGSRRNVWTDYSS